MEARVIAELMTVMKRIAAALAALIACLLAPIAFAQGTATLVPAQKLAPARPALWVVSDADTTIYLFGTVHALPPGIDWYRDAVRDAFEGADELVTEIIDPDPAAVQTLVMNTAMLPKGKTLRGELTPKERIQFDAALTKLGLPPAALDGVEPWFAAITLSTMPIMHTGFSAGNGVESTLNARAIALGRPHSALETAGYQLGVFDTLPPALQKDYLMEVVEKLPTIPDELAKMVDAWQAGDPERLARLMNSDEDNPVLSEALLFQRNRAWADWVKARLDKPGKVFIAVGAGHLAGPRSVQDDLAQRGVTTRRVQ